MNDEMTAKKFAFQKVDDIAMGAIGGAIGTTFWQTLEDSQRAGKITVPNAKSLSGKAIFTLPSAMAVSLLMNFRQYDAPRSR